ncbi:hypothetical protein C8Q70DRAFT_964516, partial [Cubamyces menziesii]
MSSRHTSPPCTALQTLQGGPSSSQLIPQRSPYIIHSIAPPLLALLILRGSTYSSGISAHNPPFYPVSWEWLLQSRI